MAKETDRLSTLARQYGFRTDSFTQTVLVVLSLNTQPARRLLKELFEFKINHNLKAGVVQYTVAHLLQKEIKHRMNYGKSLMPFTERDYNGALRKAKRDAKT